MADSEKTGWKCEACLNCGTLRTPIGIGLYDAIEAVRAAHVEESGGACTDISNLRVWPIPESGSSSSQPGEPAK